MNIICYMNKLNGGGAERVMTNIANELAEKGHNIILVNDYKMPDEYSLSENVKHYYIDGEFSNRQGNVLIRTWNRIMFLRRMCKSAHADILLSFIKDANYRAILATQGLRTKNIISVRIDPKRAYGSKLHATVAKILYSIADGCVFQTEEAAQWYPESVKKHSRIILNPIADSFYLAEGTPLRDKRIVACGRLSKQKRFDLLLEAFAEVRRVFPDYKLEIYGEGEQREVLQQQIFNLGIDDSAFLRGRVQDVQECIKDATIFALTSDFEGLPNALMEAMALGLVVVSTDCDGGGAKTLINNNENGILVQKNDARCLAAEMKRVLENSALAERLSENAERKAQSFCTKQIVNQWEQYMREVAGGTNR